ncbi:mucin-17 isoform X2 [Hyalella azteca]|uniref:Mucin-17 isoform X2 n=1 Tax=Hyalella azteca TaxID=294128 RepID=A0A8B7NLZ8_HYAAZ|nr:mucin-17 isoform X2 [Hyalella azteca]
MSGTKLLFIFSLAIFYGSTFAQYSQQEQSYEPYLDADRLAFFRRARVLTGADDAQESYELSQNDDDEDDEFLRRGGRGRMLYEEDSARNFMRDGRNFAGMMSWFEDEGDVAPQDECRATNGALNTGTCYEASACDASGGVASGECSEGGVCCIFPTVCGGTVTRNRTWFVNKDFPDYTRDPNNCELTIRRLDPRIKQVRLDFAVIELGDAVQGECVRDALTVVRGNGEVELIPPLCGDNSGQHVYMEFAYQDLKLRIAMSTQLRRKWHVLVSYVAPGDEVPSGCLQFYTDRAATVKSLNFNSGSYLFRGDLDYDVCFPKLDRTELNAGCERRTEDIDLRQSENEIHTRRNKVKRSRIQGSKRRSRSAKLPIVMAFDNNEEHEQYRTRTPSHRMQMQASSRSMPRGQPLVSRGPAYRQINQVIGQLQGTTTTGLESLLKSKNELDQMKEDFTQRAGLPEDAYYYYYYDEDDGKNFINNDLDDVSDEPAATDNYAVEHNRQEIMVLPDGAPLYSTGSKKPEKQSSSSQDKYFHLGMINNIKSQIEEQEADPRYPTPLYYEPATSAPVNLLKPEFPVASVVMFDPMTYVPDDQVVSRFEKPTTVFSGQESTAKKDPPTEISIDDLTTLSSIDPDDEYTLKHNGVQWVFLRNEKVRLTPSPTVLSTASKIILPHDIKISPGKVEPEDISLGKPHLIFKHPSGTVTEMHINSSENKNSNEKIITVIETGPVTQNYTKIKINNISELDKVIESVFDIVSDSKERLVPEKESETPPPRLVSKNTPVATTQTKAPASTPPNAFSSLPSKKNKVQTETEAETTQNEVPTLSTTSNILSSKPIPTRIIQRITTRAEVPSISVLTENAQFTTTDHVATNRPQIIRVTKLPQTTRFTKPSVVTRITSRPVPTRLSQSAVATRFTTKPGIIRITTPISEVRPPLTTTANVAQKPTIRYTTTQVRPGLKRVTVSAAPGTDIPDNIREALQTESARPVQIIAQEANEVDEYDKETEDEVPPVSESVPPTQQSATSALTEIFEDTPTDDPFANLIMKLSQQATEKPKPSNVRKATSKPLFTISTTTDGMVSTKSYTTVEDALEDLKKITTSSTSKFEDTNPTSTSPYTNAYSSPPITSSPILETLGPYTENVVETITIFNSNVCEESYIEVNDMKVCEKLFRSQPVREEAQRVFKDMERLSVRSLSTSNSPLRFSLTYDTVCPLEGASTSKNFDNTVTVAGFGQQATTGAPVAKTVNLLQYLLGWYR